MFVTKKVKIFVKLAIRFIEDLISNNTFKFAKKSKNNINYLSKINLKQEIKQSETFQNKVFNLSLASKKINEFEILPNEIFSFWKIIGNPNNKFKKGRTISNGKITEEVGGGICQVSGIIYYVSLIAGLQILERHCHSVDIYTDETRFAPLGLDATIVYGYKDLRIRNNFSFPIKFEIKVIENYIFIELLSEKKINENKLFFESKINDKYTLVSVMNENKMIIGQSKYNKM